MSFVDLKLDSNGTPTTRYETPHGIIRALLHPAEVATSLIARYDDDQLVWVFVVGESSEALAELALQHFWEQFPTIETNHEMLSTQLYELLQNDARKVGKSSAVHSIVVGALSRQIDTGRAWLAWLGTAGVRALDLNQEVLSIEKGLLAGEGWSPVHGIVPEKARPHTEILTTNALDRILVFSNSLRPAIDEIPYIGRAALQRVAESSTKNIPSVLFEVMPYQVASLPEAVTITYRWDSAYEATLMWSGSPNATGYRLEQATSPYFENPTLVAELSDARQRLYRIQPPPQVEVYYRVVPIAKNMAGKPSAPVVVTPIPLISPIIRNITWLPEDGLRIEWSILIHADGYELEASPDPDFDSPQTTIIYQGPENSFDIREDSKVGWYFRVRSNNSHFAPRTPSLWSEAKLAPLHLDPPAFEQVTPDKLIWKPVSGAAFYEIQDTSTKNVIQTDELSHQLADNKQTVYRVRALRGSGVDNTASPWSHSVAVGDDIASLAVIETTTTMKIPVLDDVSTAKIPLPIVQDTSKGSWWQIGLIAGAAALLLGLLLGLIGGPRLGIGLDPSPTPLTESDRIATATQQVVFVDSATQRSILDQDISRANAVATENARTIDDELNRNATLTTDLDNRQSTATTNFNQIEDLEVQRSTAEAEIEDLQQQATIAHATDQARINENEGLQSNLTNQNTTATQAVVDIINAQATIQAIIADSDQTIGTLGAKAIRDANAISTLEAIATSQAEIIQNLEGTAESYRATINAPTATITLTPSATITPTVRPIFGFKWVVSQLSAKVQRIK